jgi:histidyl-tRNA synthetase
MDKKPKGTRDFLPEEMERRRQIEEKLRDRARSWGYQEVSTPTFEHLELFTIKSGEGIINEIYNFEDKKGQKLALRPEITAPVLRMYVTEARYLPKPLRWFYFSDCFRYEDTQKGRYRQFWQFGIELIGPDTPEADAEVILLADELLKATGIKYRLEVGHLAPMKKIIARLEPEIQTKIMRYLDKKDFENLDNYITGRKNETKSSQESVNWQSIFQDLKVLSTINSLEDLWKLTGDITEKPRIEALNQILKEENLSFSWNFTIARGLDYYTGMVFEGYAENLGAEDQVLGGGAYRLAKLFGGDDVASTGFAIGFDRVLLSLENIEISAKKWPVVMIISKGKGKEKAFAVARAFREGNPDKNLIQDEKKGKIIVLMDITDQKFKEKLSHAGSVADFAVIIGDKEVNSETISLKDLHTSDQIEMKLEDAVHKVMNSVPR